MCRDHAYRHAYIHARAGMGFRIRAGVRAGMRGGIRTGMATDMCIRPHTGIHAGVHTGMLIDAHRVGMCINWSADMCIWLGWSPSIPTAALGHAYVGHKSCMPSIDWP